MKLPISAVKAWIAPEDYCVGLWACGENSRRCFATAFLGCGFRLSLRQSQRLQFLCFTFSRSSFRSENIAHDGIGLFGLRLRRKLGGFEELFCGGCHGMLLYLPRADAVTWTAPFLSLAASTDDLFLGCRKQSLTLGFLARELTCPPHSLRLLTCPLLRWLFIGAARPHLAEETFPLHLLLQDPKGLIDVVVSDEYLQK